MKILLKNADILQRDAAGYSVLNNACLAAEGAYITHVGKNRPDGEFDETVDMRGKLLIPGLYNCHVHAPMVLLRGVGGDLPLDRWLREEIFPREAKLTEEAVLAASRLAIAEMLACGTVSFSDMYFFPEQTARAVEESGIKANLTNAANGRIRVDFGIHAEYTCDFETVREYADVCASHGGRIHLHLAETRKEVDECIERNKKTPAQWFRDAGVFRSPAAAAHCVAMTDGDLEILREHRVSVIHNPTSNMKLGSGFARIPEMLRMGINVALGTDGAASNNNLNLFEEMHLAGLIHSGFAASPAQIPQAAAADMATVNGARLQGREDCGALAPGFRADITAIDLDRPHLTPFRDPVGMLIYSAQGSDVCLTMADGKILYRNGEYKTLDVEKTLAEARAFRF